MGKKILIITLTIMIAFSGFLTGFFSVGMLCVYAIDDDDLWQPLNSESDLVLAFQYYCKSRDLTIEGSVADAVTTATTGTFNGLCNKLGIDITALQADIKKSTDQAGNIQFLFDSTGITAYNRIFAQFLQDNELEVGDSISQNDPKIIYSGQIFIDGDNDKYLVLIKDHTASNDTNRILYEGTDYKGLSYQYHQNLLLSTYETYGVPVDYNTATAISSVICHLTTVQEFRLNYYYRKFNSNPVSVGLSSTSGSGEKRYATYMYNSNPPYMSATSRVVISKMDNENDLYLTLIRKGLTNGRLYIENLVKIENVPVENRPNASVYIYTNNTINNNNYEGDTIINNYGTPSQPTPEPTLPDPNNPNDTIHNVPDNPLGPDGIDLPDIDIPNLPLGNLSEKFPFSIPWDLVAFYAMLDAEPQAPRFNGTMDLTLVQWNYDIDLSPFDSAAELCRKLQFGLFVVGLIVASRSIIRG